MTNGTSGGRSDVTVRTSVALWPGVPRDSEDTPGKLGQAGDR